MPGYITRNKTLTYFLLQSAFLTLVFVLLSIPFFKLINANFIDQLQGEGEIRDEIVVVAIDDKSLQEIGAWPWDREIFANLLQILDRSEARVVGIDILFLENREGDAAFQQAINDSSTPAVLGSKIIEDVNCEDNSNCETVLKGVYQNTAYGFVNFNADSDGKIRKTKLWNDDNGCELSFSLRIFKSYLGLDDSADYCNRQINLRNNHYSLDDNAQLIFSYSDKSFNTVSISDVLNNQLSENYFKDKIVLVGSTAVDLRSNLNDNFTSVFGDSMPGIIIHANIVNTYLGDDFLNELSTLNFYFFILLLSILFSSVMRIFRNYLLKTIIFVITILTTSLIGIILFNANVIFPIVQSSLILTFCFILYLAYHYFFEQKENRFIRNAFGSYINSQLLHELLENPEKLKLGGQTREMTILFSDIRGFTSLSEKISPAELITLTNDYLEFMSNIIIENSGTIDKYIGDCIMAFWNAPVEDKFHARNGLLSALKMKDALLTFREMHPHYPEFDIGIGVNTGKMVVGNVGGTKKFDYTVLGDNVNLGSRIEGLTKKYGCMILVAEETKNSFSESLYGGGDVTDVDSEEVKFRLIDEVIVKGREEPLRIYEPYTSEREYRHYEKALQLYFDGKFDEALNLFTRIENDGPAKLLIDRIKFLLSSTPEKWTGVWKWEEK